MARWTGRRVAVLYGGRSAEREVSLRTGAGCADALRTKGYDVSLVDADLELPARLKEARIDVVFVALHGRWGEDGCVQGLLESMAIPYTGSGVLASALGMDKVTSKLLFRDHGLSVVDYQVLRRDRDGRVGPVDPPFGYPAVVKPAAEGSSVGVHIVRAPGDLAAAVSDAASYHGDVIVERYLKGMEVDVAVLDGEAMGAIEIVPSREFYDYVAKYTAGMTQYFFPARLPEDRLRALHAAAETAHRALGCDGVTRVDFIVTPEGTPWILEVNTMPGMTATSLVPKICAGAGVPFPDLCERLLEAAALKA